MDKAFRNAHFVEGSERGKIIDFITQEGEISSFHLGLQKG